ncbi:iron complex outermembrane receptor protein [Pseudoxanthomonas sp. 3HH-4]|uniref:TonB-dependent receptor plug domain-containing protein n=1 Tax=Pseudoxanthomonas sp. 3HH-4 TaxID=1690214 RepID=UPI00114F0B33|nr:TonB-dependent receptor [Pseudoxanthomonas sp. 3HH-4]TQM06808.1 iron complex outermembrane receptor protein [Pseudoxanthomonas sp. 3HH-4]
MTRKLSPLTFAISLALVAPAAFAQESAPAEARTLDTLIVTGTRVSDRTVAESQSPIDIITPEALQATGTTELATALARALPSLNFPRPAVTDGTSGVRPAQLRGLSPDQVLILVNGKRRHISALVNVNGSIGRGSSAVDLNAIPVSAIERVEVLRDGASAQYGSDAIAGVVNIVLKGSGKGGSLIVDVGGYSAGDGRSTQLSGDTGVSFGDGRGFVHVAGQLTQQDETDRAGPYQGTAPNTGNNPAIGEVAFVYGDPQVDAGAVSANAGFAISDTVDAYATAIASNRDIVSFAFYRSPNHSGQGALLAQVYPDGYVPEINQLSQDRSLVAGIKGDTESGWKWDVSYNYGYNHLKFYTQNSINYSLGATSPRRFYDGALEYTQNVLNADISKPLEIGLAYPATLSFGAEYRQEKWNQSPGESNSYAGSGAQGFAGFTPANAVHSDRDSYAAYMGLEADVTEKFSAGIAGRYEDYSDFGSEVSGKLSARYAFTDAVALRATVASGFRAPALAQQYYQVVTSQYNATLDRFFESGTFPATGPVAQALGADALTAETSLSYGLGLVLQPIDRLYVTIDAYQIDIDDRIVLSSNLLLGGNAAAQALLASLGVNGVTSARYFTNAADTRTRGVDVIAQYTVPLANSTLNLTAGYNYNKTEIQRIAPNPPELTALGANLWRIGRDEQGRIEEGYPRDKTTLTAAWNLARWDFTFGATRYGEFTTRVSETGNPVNDQTYGAKWILDASTSYRPSENWTLTLGADNLLDEYPDRTIFPNSNSGQFPYSSQSPGGFNGAYVYGRVAYTW